MPSNVLKSLHQYLLAPPNSPGGYSELYLLLELQMTKAGWGDGSVGKRKSSSLQAQGPEL